MSANILVVGGNDPHIVRRARFVPVPDLPEGDVREIGTAPSARRRREAQLAEAPAMRRHPVRPRTVGRSVSLPVGRLLLGGVAALALAVVGAGVGALLQPAEYAGPTRVHSVTPGESVWSLAQTIETDRSLEEVVVSIEQLNDIQGGLTVGDQIVLPIN